MIIFKKIRGCHYDNLLIWLAFHNEYSSVQVFFIELYLFFRSTGIPATVPLAGLGQLVRWTTMSAPPSPVRTGAPVTICSMPTTVPVPPGGQGDSALWTWMSATVIHVRTEQHVTISSTLSTVLVPLDSLVGWIQPTAFSLQI